MVCIRQCEDKDIPGLFEIFKAVYRFNPRMTEKDYFDWQFKYGPFCRNDKYTFLISCDGNKIKGFLGYMPVEYRSGNDVHAGCWTYNWYSVERDISVLDLLGRLIELYDAIFLIGYSNDSGKIFRAYQMSMTNLPRWIAVMDSEKAAALSEITQPADLDILREGEIKLAQIYNQGCGDIVSCDRFDPEEEFILHRWKGIRYYIRRTGRYLNWRYVDIPKHDYNIIRAKRSDQFAIYRIEKIMGFEESVIRILEWNFCGIDSRKALSYIIETGRREKSVLIDFFCTADMIGRELEKAGFFKESTISSRIPFRFRPIHHEKEIGIAITETPHRRYKDVRFEEWYITKGDSDIDRVKL